jgi:hypothetical protein
LIQCGQPCQGAFYFSSYFSCSCKTLLEHKLATFAVHPCLILQKKVGYKLHQYMTSPERSRLPLTLAWGLPVTTGKQPGGLPATKTSHIWDAIK